MNIRHYILQLLLVFVCLFVLFSHSLTAYATDSEEISTFFGVEYPIIYNNPNISLLSYDVTGFTVDMTYYDIDGNYYFIDNGELDLTDHEVYKNNDGRVYICYRISLPESVSKGTINDYEFKISHSSGSYELDEFRVENSNWARLSSSYTYEVDSASTDQLSFRLLDVSSDEGSYQKLYIYFWYTPTVDITVFSSEVLRIVVTEVSSNSLLGSIIQIVKDIWSGITELPTKIASSIKGFFDNVVNAVVNLGNTILDGIKNLFIPSEEDITNMKDKWDTLLSDRFGALYQVGSLISDYAAAFTEQNKNTITFPSVTIPLAGAEFTFGGWEVQVVPDGFGIVFDTLKLITSILATLLFANGLKKRFDKLLGGADDI